MGGQPPFSLSVSTPSLANSGGATTLTFDTKEKDTTMIKTPEREAQLTVKCPKCGECNSPGIIHCAKCNKELMPLLAFITLLGLFLLVPITLAIGWTIPFSKEPTAFFSCIIGVVGIFSLLGLRRGRYWVVGPGVVCFYACFAHVFCFICFFEFFYVYFVE